MTDQPRQPQGVPGGGRFASKAHAEVTIDLTDPDAVPLPVLRRAAMQAVGTAIEELESRNMESLRHSYQAFPTASYGAALESLRRMRSEMCGDPPPQYLTGADVAFDEFRNRTAFIPGRRPITEIQTEAIEQIDRAVESLDHKAVAQCRDADRSFPGDAYAEALANLRAIRDQIHVGSPPKISSDVAKAWSGLTIKGPQMVCTSAVSTPLSPSEKSHEAPAPIGRPRPGRRSEDLRWGSTGSA